MLSSSPARIAAATAVVLVAAGLPSVPGSAAGRGVVAAPGAAGIGDPYWPLDGNGGIDALHYDVRDRYDFSTRTLSGTTTVRLRATAALSRFNLDLLLPVSSVLVDGVPAAYTKPDPHELQITPAAAVPRGRVVDVVVTYAGRPGPIGYAGERNWLAGAGEVVAINEPHMAPWWFAANDHPLDKATFDVRITGPATHQVISNGLPAGRTVSGSLATTHWRSTDPMTTYNAFFALGRYQVERTVQDRLPSFVAVSRDLDPSRRGPALRALRRSAEVTAWLARRLGPYPFESTGGVVSPLAARAGFALENQTRPVYPVAPSRSLMVHELAHQWFGNSVSLRRWRDIWLNEGLATFMEHYDVERRGGQSAQTWLRDERGFNLGVPSFWRTPVSDPGPAEVFGNAVYVRGAMTIQALRHRLGERVFWKVVRTWVRTRRHGHGTTTGFVALAERISGQRLGGFFRAWLEAPRAPSYTEGNGLR
ncbi:M1 family metallopeptidase [Nocardioides sp. C4-1]|uniref:M1 family metallopeptidase n=1 Tax=Nocardioides sp. C4-1 TaxID=3151851 RepID=UPI0032673FB7